MKASRKVLHPIFIEPCLATLVHEPPSGIAWGHEIKFDGYRLQVHIFDGRARLLTRRGLDWTERFGSLARKMTSLRAASATIDGEVVVMDDHGASSFVELVNDLKAKRSSRFVFYAFDLLFLDGKDTRHLSLQDRKRLLQKVFARRQATGQVRYSEHVEGHGPTMLNEACKIGLEGIISKRLDMPYRSGRGVDWLKAKCFMTDEFVIAGYVLSKAVSHSVGALVVGFYKAGQVVYAGRIGTGFTRETSAALWRHLVSRHTETTALSKRLDKAQARGVIWVVPDLVAQVEYRGWTTDGLLRHAVFKGLREDKPPVEVQDPRV